MVQTKVSRKSETQRYNLSDRLGEYVRLSDKGKVMDIQHFRTEPSYETQSYSLNICLVQEGYLAPVYAAVGPGAPSYLYSHHPTGKVTHIPSIHNDMATLKLKSFKKNLVFRCSCSCSGVDHWQLGDKLVAEVEQAHLPRGAAHLPT